jgi:hypothetical protein
MNGRRSGAVRPMITRRTPAIIVHQ